jgi:hypothetical protein
MKGIKQMSIGLACIASLAVVACNGRSTAVGYDAGRTSENVGYDAGRMSVNAGYDAGHLSANAPALDMDSGMPPSVDLKASVQAQTGVTTSAWDAGFTQHAVAATVTGHR